MVRWRGWRKKGGLWVKFEEALARLEEIVSQLESDERSLDESLRLFEEGVGLSKRCQELLQEAEGKIEQLLADGSTETLTITVTEDELS